MIPGLISPTDWIWSLGEKCPKSPSSLCLSLCLTQGSIYSNMIRWCQPQYEPLKRRADQNGEYEKRGFNAASLQKACRAFMSCPTVWTCCHWQQTQINCRPFRPWPVEQWRLGYLNCCAIWGAIKNHLGLYKGHRVLLRIFLWCRWKSVPRRGQRRKLLQGFYDPECYISI